MTDYTLYPKVKPTGELPPLVTTWLDERFVNHSEWSKQSVTGVSVATHGAMPDTTSSQTAAIQAAVNSAATFGVSVIVPKGTYTMTGQLNLPEGTTLELGESAVLDFGASSSGWYIDVRGSKGSSITYPASIKKGALQIPLSGHALKARDWVMIQSADVFDPDSTNICHGELIQVREVGTGTVAFLTPLCDDYTTSVTITPVTLLKNVEIKGGTIRGNFTPAAGKTGLRAQYTDGLRVTGTRFEGIDNVHVTVQDSTDAWFSWCQFRWAESNVMGYGFSVGNTTRDSGCMYSIFRGVRHSLSTNNTAGANAGGILRRILFQGNTVEYTSYAISGSQAGGDAIDTHTAAEDIWIRHNVVSGSQGQSINLECASGEISGNTILNSANTAISYHNESRRPGRVTITGNTVSGAGGNGISSRTGGRGTQTPTESMIITGNRISDVTAQGIQVGYILTDKGVVVTGNTVNRAGGVPIRLVRLDGAVEHSNIVNGGATMGVECDRVTNAVLGPDSINAGAPTGAWTGMSLKSVTYSKVTPGAVHVTDPAGVGVRVESSCSNLSLGPTAHLNAPTKLVNNGGSTVAQY